MVRTFPKYIFLTSLLITLVVFGAGLFFGYNLDVIRTGEVEENLLLSEIETESYLVEEAFWDSFGGDNCEFAEARISSLSGQLVELGQYLSGYDQRNIFEEDQFDYLARQYFLLEIKAYTLLNNLKAECELENDYILFFYTEGEDDSTNQGYVLDKAVEHSNGTLDIYSISKDFEGDQAIDTLVAYYNVTVAPTIIINGEIKQEQYTSYQEVRELLNAEWT
tara:strand:+ start:1772 stop:2434 length:663 start_codon:yes stop_codon:yes gene_type:complete